jgi:cysteine dioxygenase
VDRSDATYKKGPRLVIPPTEVGGYLKYGLFGREARQDLNDPPASAGGISARGDCPALRLALNYPPISIGGIDDAATVLITFSRPRRAFAEFFDLVHLRGPWYHRSPARKFRSRRSLQMSTDIARSIQHAVAIEGEVSQRDTFENLTSRLGALESIPELHDLDRWLGEVKVQPDDLRPYLGFKPGTYARHRVFRNEFVELLVLCWRPGQRTPIHDHNGSHGAVRVCEGVMWETMFGLDAEKELYYKSAREWRSGQVTGADVPDIHQLGNPEVSGRNLVTLHLYAPPLGVLNTYKVGSSEVGHYTPDEFMDGAGI